MTGRVVMPCKGEASVANPRRGSGKWVRLELLDCGVCRKRTNSKSESAGWLAGTSDCSRRCKVEVHPAIQ